MKLISNDFENEEHIDPKFTCDGENISPHLKWKDEPTETKSFALSLEDPDAPSGNFIHWYVYNIPPDVHEIPKDGPIPGKELKNDFGNKRYGGPCPPSGMHHYYFRVYALDQEELDDVGKGNFKLVMKDHTLDSAQLIGLYSKDQ